MTTTAQVFEVKLTRGRRVAFDRLNGVYRVAYHTPKGDRAWLRGLQTKADCGNREAQQRLRSLPTIRTTAINSSLRLAVLRAIEEQEPQAAERLAGEVVMYADLMGWDR